MKVKELDLTANVAWSPAAVNPIYLAAGTAAQQLDATFNTSSALEIYALNLVESGHDMPKIASVPVENRYHKLIWGEAGMAANGSRPSGVIVGGLDKGFITVYDAGKIISGCMEESVLFSKDKHTGPVQALDFNPFQTNLLASGASESEIFIWDLNKLETPMTPGAKSQPLDDVRCIAWNRQVQHILASTFASRCVVWDLRKNDPIIKVSDSTSRMKCKAVAWHPEVATQLCLASEDDHTPVIQIWDLRLASSPLRTLEHHQRGVLSVAWCQQDSDLLLSCGKDNVILCWNPNSNQPGGEVLSRIDASNQWSFDVSWCPKNPGVIAASSFDGHVSIYSLMGGQQQVQPGPAISDSFPGMETMAQPVQNQQVSTVQLKKPPKWLKRPCGANFGFGGKLVTFETTTVTATQQQQQQGAPASLSTSSVYISNVITEPGLVERSVQLETSLQNQNLPEFCQMKINAIPEASVDQLVWKFINANFEVNPRQSFLELLGYGQEAGLVDSDSIKGEQPVNELVDEFQTLGSGKDVFEVIQSDQTPIILNTVGEEGLLSKALLTGNLENAVGLCLKQDRMADALILALQGGEFLFNKTKLKYFEKCKSKESELIKAVTTGEWSKLISRLEVDQNQSWKEALVAAITYSPTQEEFSALCTSLGNRLKGQEALLCYICAGDLDNVVRAWMDSRDTTSSPDKLQDLVEVVMTLKKAVERLRGPGVDCIEPGGPLAEKLTLYANLLAAQGALSAAAEYINAATSGTTEIKDESIALLKDRLNGALGNLGNRSAYGQQQQQQQQQQKTAPAAAGIGSRHRQYSQSNTPYNPAPPAAANAYNYPGSNQYAASGPPSLYDPGSRSSSITSFPSQQQPQVPVPPPPMFNPSQPSAPSAAVAAPAPAAVAVATANNQMPFNRRKSSADHQAPQVSLFTPDYSQTPAANVTPMTPGGLPPNPAGRSYVPDHGGPGHMPPVSNGSGWNDPPAMSMSKPKNTGPGAMTTPDPITQPLFSVQQHDQQQPQQQQISQPGIYDPSNYYAQQQQQQQPQQQQQQPQSEGIGGGGGFSQMMQQPQQPIQQQQPQQQQQERQQQQRQQLEPPKPKGPIPAEHQVLQRVFDDLRTRCIQAASHPQVKRKLDDVGKKLEILYDKLRENSLPPATLSGLHQIPPYIWAYDYNSCLLLVNQLVSTGSFAILSQFLPGVKVLIQVASQLGVYLEQPK